MANINNGLNNQGGASRLHYAVTLTDAPPPPANAVLKADVTAVINRSSSIKNPAGIEVLTEGQRVILRGKVTSDSERRLVEGMIRLTPGVREVVNELQVP
jgi:hypothetical protein